MQSLGRSNTADDIKLNLHSLNQAATLITKLHRRLVQTLDNAYILLPCVDSVPSGLISVYSGSCRRKGFNIVQGNMSHERQWKGFRSNMGPANVGGLLDVVSYSVSASLVVHLARMHWGETGTCILLLRKVRLAGIPQSALAIYMEANNAASRNSLKTDQGSSCMLSKATPVRSVQAENCKLITFKLRAWNVRVPLTSRDQVLTVSRATACEACFTCGRAATCAAHNVSP